MWKYLSDKVHFPFPGYQAEGEAPLQKQISVAKWESDALLYLTSYQPQIIMIQGAYPDHHQAHPLRLT